MEELFGVVWVFIMIAVAVANSVKKKQQQSSMTVSTAQPAQPAAQPASMASMLPPRPEGSDKPVRPTVHTHLELNCDTHDAPDTGSLGAVRTEGTDPCHDDLLPHRTAAPMAAETQTSPSLTLDWSGDAMVKAFVMQEILTRPAQRRTR
ncbi:MAG: hypothetical protein IJ343_12185 [Clostridia bacterium]|nr:hypothetical protein [Clostridia bacterium]